MKKFWILIFFILSLVSLVEAGYRYDSGWSTIGTSSASQGPHGLCNNGRGGYCGCHQPGWVSCSDTDQDVFRCEWCHANYCATDYYREFMLKISNFPTTYNDCKLSVKSTMAGSSDDRLRLTHSYNGNSAVRTVDVADIPDGEYTFSGTFSFQTGTNYLHFKHPGFCRQDRKGEHIEFRNYRIQCVYCTDNTQTCSANTECCSNYCTQLDYDSSGKFCCSSGQCSHDGTCFSNTTESGNYKCSSGTWKLKDGVSCTANAECYSNYCVNNVCRPTSTYCGDNVCDTGENCPAENISCTNNKCYEPTCTNGCEQTAVASGSTDEACTAAIGCSSPPCKCDGSGNCVTANPCVLNTVSIASKDCSTNCWTSNKIGVTITATGNCPSTMYIQVDAIDADAQCDIQFLNGDLQGINVTCTSTGCQNWTIQDMSDVERECEGETINAVAAALYDNAAHTNRIATATSVSGSFNFKATQAEDSDDDGVPDDEDDCPTEKGPKCNDGCPLLDEDEDNYQESTTKCPNFDYCPDEGEGVDSDGCPVESTCFKYWDCSQTSWSSCVNNKMQRKGSCTHGVLPAGCSEAEYIPPKEKDCVLEEEFPFFTNLNLILVSLILIGYYLHKKRNI